MDESNYDNVLLHDYGGVDGFDLVMDIVEDGCRGLLLKIKSEL